MENKATVTISLKHCSREFFKFQIVAMGEDYIELNTKGNIYFVPIEEIGSIYVHSKEASQ
jgi:hypothetical protein